MPTAIALALLIASLPGLSWVSFSASAFSSPFSVSSTLPRTRLRICPLIAASFTTFQPTGLDEELDRLLQEYEIYLPLPTWIPEDYGKPEFEIEVVETLISFGTYFPKGDYYLTMTVKKDRPGYESVASGYMEKDDDYYEEYTVEGETFIIVSNMGRLQAKWFEQPYQLLITGELTPEEMHKILDSIFERS